MDEKTRDMVAWLNRIQDNSPFPQARLFAKFALEKLTECGVIEKPKTRMVIEIEGDVPPNDQELYLCHSEIEAGTIYTEILSSTVIEPNPRRDCLLQRLESALAEFQKCCPDRQWKPVEKALNELRRG